MNLCTVVSEVNVTDGLFKLNVMTIKFKINTNKSSSAYRLESSYLWHDRLENVNYNVLRKLINMQSIPTF